jgi:hypothetical protein
MGVSTATVVDGICSLISSNPKRDRILMQQKSFLTGRSRDMISEIKDSSPLRSLFIAGRDLTIYDTIINYFSCFDRLYWGQDNAKSYIAKTVGVQAAFDIFKLILIKENSDSPETIEFENYLVNSAGVDFSDKFFQASGIGRSRIKNTIAISAGLVLREKIKKSDLPFYDEVLSGKSTNIPKDKWMWEEDAENAVINALEKAEWNYESNTVSLLEDYDFDKIIEFKDYDKFFYKLVEIAEIAFVSSLPSDTEFANEQREKFEPEDLVENYLLNYEANLKKLGWW